MLTLILGGARSGKSSYAEALAKQHSSVLYVATAIAFDEGMKERIRHHQSQRPSHWRTLEQYKSFSGEIEERCVLVDCMTLMVSNLLMEGEGEGFTPKRLQEIETSIFKEVDGLLAWAEKKDVILVSNEVGLGLASSYELGNAFRDIGGRVNQYLAQRAQRVYFMVAGLPLVLKEES